MIIIKTYLNGYEILGHAEEKVCHQVSLWHWITSNLITGTDRDAKEYTSDRDNPQNPHKGYSWLTFTPHKYNLDWIMEDFVVSAERWLENNWQGQVVIKKTNDLLEKS